MRQFHSKLTTADVNLTELCIYCTKSTIFIFRSVVLARLFPWRRNLRIYLWVVLSFKLIIIFGKKDATVEWLRCSTRIHKVQCLNLSISIHGMTLDKSLTAHLSRMTHSYRTEYIISQYVGRKRVQIPSSVKRKRR